MNFANIAWFIVVAIVVIILLRFLVQVVG